MPQFRSREEYEKWRAQRMGAYQEVPREKTAKEEPPRRPMSSPPRVLRPETETASEKKPKPDLETSFDLDLPADLEPASDREVDLPEESPPEEDFPFRRQFPPRGGRLRTLGELFGDSWGIFKSRSITLICLYLLSITLLGSVPVIFALIGSSFAFLFALDRRTVMGILIYFGMIPGAIAFAWGMAALTFATADENLGIGEALGKAWSEIWAFIWAGFLVVFIITGGFLLFVIPGILFLVWFLFSLFVLAVEDVRGMSAILKSKEYVRGYGWSVLLRVLVVLVVFVILSMVPVIGPILPLLSIPFVLIFLKLIYDDLKSIKGSGVSYSFSAGEKLRWVGVGILGYVALPIVLLALTGAKPTVPRQTLQGTVSSRGNQTAPPTGAGRGSSLPLPPGSGGRVVKSALGVSRLIEHNLSSFSRKS